MKRNLLIILMLLCVFVSGHTRGQTYNKFMHMTMDVGASMVVGIFEDQSGMIWLGTNKGLYSFDDYTAYPHNNIGSQKMKTHIYCGTDVDGSRLYLGSDNGLMIYNYRAERYEQLPVKSPADIRAMAKDGNTIWLGSLEGLYTYQLETHKIKRFDAKRNKGLSHNTIYSIVKGGDGRMYIGTYDGLCYYNNKAKRFTTIPLPGSKRKNNVFVNSLLEDRQSKTLWIGTEGGLFCYSLISKKVERIAGFNDNSIKALSLDDSHKLLVGTDNGLFVYAGNRIEQHIMHDSREQTSLSNDVVWSILHDSYGNIWLGTDDGVSMKPKTEDVPFIPISQITGTGAGNHFYAIYRDNKGLLWLGGTNGLISTDLSLSAPYSSQWFRVDNPVHPIAHNRIRKIYEDRDRHLWICTDGGVHRLENGRWHRFNLEDNTRTKNANWAYCMYEDERGRLWIATCLGGILVVDKHKLENSKDYCIADYSFNMQNGLAGMFISQIVPDNEGYMWVLLYNNGLQRINMRTMKVETIRIRNAQKDDNPSFLFSDSERNIWLGEQGGVLSIGNNRQSSKMIPFKNFRQSEVTSMTEVNNEIWVATTDGIWIINKRNKTSRRVHNTIHSFSCIYYDSRSNLIFIGGVDGLICATPESFSDDTAQHDLLLTSVYVNNELRFSQNGESVRFSKKLSFSADENHLIFEFSDLPYSKTEKNHFIYRLKGVDKEWIALPQNSNHITFNNLPYDEYTLQISRIEANGDPSHILSVPFRILPPWYYSWWAKMIYTILFGGLIVWCINFYRMRNRLRLEHVEKERVMEQSRQKMEFFTNISHDFKTPLSMIIAPLSRLIQEIKDKNTQPQLELAYRNAMKLTAMIHQLIDFDRVDNNVNSTLMPGRVDFVEMARKVFKSFEDGLFNEKDITSEFSSNMESCYQQIDELKMESAITNVLSNAAKYTPRGGKVTMAVDIGDKTISVTIRDNGIGIPSKDLPYVSQRFFQSSATKGKKDGTGIGLYMVRAYTELHGGTLGITSEEGKGTTVTLRIPYRPEQIATQAMEAESSTPSADDECLPTVVIVDDNKEVADFIKSILCTSFKCMTAENGKEGLEMCLSDKPSLIITDMMMPVMNGMEMCQQLRKHVPTSTTPIIMLTAKDDKSTELESIRLSVDAFLTKPFDANILLSRSKQLAEKHKQMEKKERMEVIRTPKKIEVVSEDEKFLSQITTLIEDHLGDFDFNVNSLCEQMGLGNKSVYRKLKQLTGQTPVEYIKSIRMKKAAMLLGQQKFTVSEVMYRVGFSNTSYFSKCFQAEFGVTPRQYAEKESNT